MIVSLKLHGKLVFVIGNSKEAIDRANGLIKEGAIIRIYGILADTEIGEVHPSIRVIARIPSNNELKRSHLVIATDRDKKLNDWLLERSQKLKFLLNTLDEIKSCNFFHLATREVAENVEVAVSTNGRSPAYASRFAKRISDSFNELDADVFRAFVETRQQLKNSGLSTFDFDWDYLESSIRDQSSSYAVNNFQANPEPLLSS